MIGSVAQLGYGRWGANIARNLNALAGERWTYLVEVCAQRRAVAASLYPNTRVTDDYDSVLADSQVSAIVIATPAATHACLAHRALAAGKHVFVEKPLAISVDDAVDLAQTAERRRLVLMVGHIFEYVPAVRTAKRLIAAGEIGDVRCLHSQRLDHPRIESDIDAFWDLGAHDVAIANYLLGSDPQWVSAHAHSEETFLATIGYPDGVKANLHLSRVDPCKTRRTTITGSRGTLIYDDMDVDCPVRIVGNDRRVDCERSSTRRRPALEPLGLELQHFLECVSTGERPRTDGWNGVRVVAALAAADASWRAGGAQTPLTLPARCTNQTNHPTRGEPRMSYTASPDRGLRVLAVTNMWPEEGDFRGIFVKEQVDSLRQLGVHVDVEVVAQSRGRRDYLLAALRIRRRVRTGDYDVVHIHHGMAALACRFIGPTPRVLSLYGHDINWRWQRWITKLGWGGVAAKVYVARRMADVAGDSTGHVIPTGVDFTLFAPADRTAARAALGIGEGENVVLFGGAPDNWVKGYDVFHDVVEALRSRYPGIRELILAEPGATRQEVARKFAAADVLLFTSREGFEGSPSVIKEASVIGLPVVSTDVGDVAEILAGVVPSAVVGFPRQRRGGQARQELVHQLTDRTAETLEANTRSNGRDRNAWLASDKIGQIVINMYLGVTAAEAAKC